MPPELYTPFVQTRTFAIRHNGRQALGQVRAGDLIFAYLSGAKTVAGLFEAVGAAFEDTTPLVPGRHYPFRLRVRPVVVLSDEARVPYEAFHDRLEVTREHGGDFGAVVRRVLHPLPTVDEKVLEFLVRTRQGQSVDFDRLRAVLDAYLDARRAEADEVPHVQEPPVPYMAPERFDRAEAVERLLAYLDASGFIYAPWEVAAYVTALRTKPFVILAGVTGTGKSKLPALVAAGTGGVVRLVPVRPDWTDSGSVLGYTTLAGRFRPGAVLEALQAAEADARRYHVCVLDEMNLARVEHYLAEVLSRIEDRRPAPGGGYRSAPLLDERLPVQDADWERVGLPPNAALVGTVNMDESAHGFSRKVLDRAFTLELSDVDLTAWEATAGALPEPSAWPVEAWIPRALRLGDLAELSDAGRATVERAVQALSAANELLVPAQVQAAYRTRDEVALFLLHAAETPEAFRTHDGTPVDPLDLALHMKLLPRLGGGSPALRAAVRGLLGWAVDGSPLQTDADARAVLDEWEAAGRPHALPEARHPRTAARLALMWERLLAEGFTSYWT